MPYVVRRIFTSHPEVPALVRARQSELQRVTPETQLTLSEGSVLQVDERWPDEPGEVPLGTALEAHLQGEPQLLDVVVRAAKPEAERDKLIPILETERLRLRALRHADAPRVFEALGDADTMRYWSRGPFGSLEEARGYMSWNVEADEAMCWAITTREAPDDGLGWIILRGSKPQVYEVGYIIVPDGRGRGLAREGVRAVVDYAFAHLAARRIWADIDPDNRPSIKLLEALGFEREGYLRQEWETHIGVRDSVIMGALRSERTK